MTPKISLIIPIYNAEAFLEPCLASIEQQTIFEDVQVILVDDGSKDGSPAICDAFGEKHKNAKVIHKENGGVSVARNTGIEAADGEFIGFADADDLLMPEMLEKLYNACVKTGANISMCGFLQPYPDKDVTILYPFDENVLLDKEKIRSQIASFMIRDEACNALWNKIFRKSVILENHIFMTEGRKYAEDREFVLRFLAVASGACYVPYVGYYYRYVETGAIQKPRDDYGKRVVQQYREDCLLFEALGISKDVFLQKGAACFGGKIMGALSFAENKLTGKTRKKVLRLIMEDAQLQDLLSEIMPFVLREQTRFVVSVLTAAQKCSVFRVRCIFLAMRWKVAIYNRLKGSS